ncbi:MAG: hypothetical protein O3A01_04830 [bacterium]|nr:hypothetical protein [bacterium]
MKFSNLKTGTQKEVISLDFSASTVTIEVKEAIKRSEIIESQYLIAEVYNKYYKIFFSKDYSDLEAKIEPYPHRYIYAKVGDEIVGCAGLYTHNTYVEKYGDVSTEDIINTLLSLNLDPNHYNLEEKREITKIVSKPEWVGKGIGAFIWGAAYSKFFLGNQTEKPPIITCCAKLSTFQYFEKFTGITTHKIKSFPEYKIHEYYRSQRDPMESRLVIPNLDIPNRWYNLKIPSVYNVGKDTNSLKFQSLG